MKPVKCNKDCHKCNKYGSARTDTLGDEKSSPNFIV